MRVSREQAILNRERVLDAAATLYREHGFSGIGVADLMKAAGLTHGGFYGQFNSKEDLMALACERAFERSADNWRHAVERGEGDPLAALASAYLSTAHRDHPGHGCVVASVGAEAARQGPAVRASITAGVESLVGLLASWVPGRSAAARRSKSLATFSTMVGALVLSRAVHDRAFSEEILQASLSAVRQG